MELWDSSSFNWVPQINIKKDPRQLTFTVPPELLPITRCVLYQRYFLDTNKTSEFDVSWVDETHHPIRPIILHGQYTDINNIPVQLPNELFQTKLQVTCGTNKIVKVTFYYSTGTILAQGNYCPKWRYEEFDALVACIRSIYSHLGNAEQIHEDKGKLSKLPLPPVPDLRRSSRLQKVLSPITEHCRRLINDDNVLNHSTSHLTSNSCCNTDDHFPVLTLPPVQKSESDIERRVHINLPASSYINDEFEQCDYDGDWIDVMPRKSSATKLSKPTGVFRRKPTARPLTLTGTKHALTHLNKQLQQLTTIVNKIPGIILSEIETAKAQVKNDLKTHFQKKLDETSDLITELSSKIKILEAQNQTLKSQMGDMRKRLIVQKESHSFQTETPLFRNSTSTLNLVHSSISTTLNKQSSDSPNKCLDSLSSDFMRSQSGLKGSHSGYQPACSSNNLLKNQPPSSTSNIAETNPNSSSSNKFSCSSHKSSHVNQDNHSDSSVKYNSAQYHQAVNTNSSISSQRPRRNTKESHAEHISYTSNTDTGPRGLSPRKLLAQKTVEPESKNILLGDSVIKLISKPELLFSHSSCCQTICVPGLTVEDVIHWLRDIPTSPHIRQLTIHIGINSCFKNVVTKYMWLELLTLLRKCFPQAKLFLSTIIPPVSRQSSLAKTVSVSNLHLLDLCHSEGISYIDNTNTFTTSNGLPKKALYHDDVHPSRLGTARLACNIKNGSLPFCLSMINKTKEILERLLHPAPARLPSGSPLLSPENTVRRPPLLPLPDWPPASSPLSLQMFPSSLVSSQQSASRITHRHFETSSFRDAEKIDHNTTSQSSSVLKRDNGVTQSNKIKHTTVYSQYLDKKNKPSLAYNNSVPELNDLSHFPPLCASPRPPIIDFPSNVTASHSSLGDTGIDKSPSPMVHSTLPMYDYFRSGPGFQSHYSGFPYLNNYTTCARPDLFPYYGPRFPFHPLLWYGQGPFCKMQGS